MKKILYQPIGMDTIIKKHKTNDDYKLKGADVFNIIEDMNNLILMNMELDYITDLKKDVSILINKENTDKNTVIRYKDIAELKVDELTERLIESLDEQGLVLVIEPNKNLFIDIDYDKLLRKIIKYSTLNYANLVKTLILIQETAIVDELGKLNIENVKSIHQEAIISTDFEKNPEIFKYMLNNMLSYLEKFYFIYK